jgi:hypothetical protein
VLSKNVELTLKVLRIELTTLASVTITVMFTEDNEWLKNSGFFAACCGAKNSSISGNFSPAQYSKT